MREACGERRSHDLGEQDVVQPDHPGRAARRVGDHEARDPPFHQGQRPRGELLGPDHLRVAGHAFPRAPLEQAGPVGELLAAQVAVGEDPDQAAPVVHHGGDPEPLAGHLLDGFLHRGLLRHHRDRVPGVHQVTDLEERLPPEAPARVQRRVVLRTQAAQIEERHGERVAHRQRRGGAGGRREIHAGRPPPRLPRRSRCRPGARASRRGPR